MNKETYTNRYNDTYTFTPDEDGNLLWEGNFEYHRYGYEETPDNINMVDPSGGPYISTGFDAGLFHSELKGKKVTGFLPIDTGYKLILKDEG